MAHLGFFVLLYIACVLDAGRLGGLTADAVQPGFLFLAMITAVLSLGQRSAILWAAVAGLLSDCLAGGPLGVDMLLFVWLAWLWQLGIAGKEHSSGLIMTLATFATGFLWQFSGHSIRLLLAGQACDHSLLMWQVTATAATSSLLMGSYWLIRGLTLRVVATGAVAR